MSYVRRLPVYLLLDCSGSMTGEPIESVRQGIKMLVNELKALVKAEFVSPSLMSTDAMRVYTGWVVTI